MSAVAVRLLLDTHSLVWWWSVDPRLPTRVREMLADRSNTIAVSAISAVEIAIKVRIGRLPEMEPHIHQFNEGVVEDGFDHLDVRHDHAVRAGLLPGPHRDPFDRLIAAQGLIEDYTVVTRDPAFAGFGCKLLW